MHHYQTISFLLLISVSIMAENSNLMCPKKFHFKTTETFSSAKHFYNEFTDISATWKEKNYAIYTIGEIF